MTQMSGARPGTMPTTAVKKALAELPDDAVVTITIAGHAGDYQVHGWAPLLEWDGERMVNKLELRAIPRDARHGA